jgi:hypothetical protein
MFKPGLRPAIARSVSLLAGLAVMLGLFASAASADVNRTTNPYWGQVNILDCHMYIGDEASSSRYAIGDTTVKCAYPHNIWVYTELVRNGVVVRTSANPYSYFPDTTYVHDVPTGAYRCGGNASWYTISYIIIDGGAWRSWYGPTGPFTPGC